jgi:23S rRNA (adenine2030-N6)-methyltransferase
MFMLSYRHGYHAGNYADVLKHTVLVHALEYMKQKEKTVRIVDTHAGAGLYKLRAAQPQKTGEYLDGIAKLWGRTDVPEALAAYLHALTPFNATSTLEFYPGSPMIMQKMMREQDHLYVHELHSTDIGFLRQAIGNDKRVKVVEGDGFAGLQSVLPPPDRRALVLIDPSYEIKSDYQLVAKQVIQAHKRFATGTFMIWYPVVLRQRIDDLERALIKSGIRNIQLMEFGLRPDNPEHGMTSSGMIVINPPWTLWRAMEETLPWLVDHLTDPSQGFYRLEQLVAE